MQVGFAVDLCPPGVAPTVLNSGANLSGNPLSVQPWHSESVPLPLLEIEPTHQFVWLFHNRVGQSACVCRPLHPRLPLHNPLALSDVAHDLLEREHWL